MPFAPGMSDNRPSHAPWSPDLSIGVHQFKHVLLRKRSGFLLALGTACLLCAAPARASELPIRVEGVEGPIAENVVNHVRTAWALGHSLSTERRRASFLEQARHRAQAAMRPWGYYQAHIQADLQADLQADEGDSAWRLEITIDPGPPVLVEHADIQVMGEGADQAGLRQWLERWPLEPGTRLDQTIWSSQKDRALDLARAGGFLKADFTTHRIALDLDANRAQLELILQTGQRAVMGKIEYEQDTVQPHVLEPIARFDPGDPYRVALVEELRLDLWRTGYFGDIEVLEQKHLDREPPVVDFRVRLSPRNRVTHQFSVGYGTDTLFRTQYHWTRHLLSDRGDSVRLGAGWRQQDSELQATGEYRLPRRTNSLQFWLANGILRRETQEFVLKDDNDQEVLRIAKGEIFDTQLRLGRLRLHNNPWSNRRIQSTVFVDLLRERDNFNQALNEAAAQPAGDFLDDLFGNTDHTVAVGVDLDWPVIRGSGFMTTGHHERAWALTANEAWGSEKSFSQVYLSSRWNRLLGHRWKILLRGEVGWSDADLKPFYVSGEDGASTLLVTELPYRYSFRAGGSQSVRGYGYNDLSTNGIGSNHLLTGSAELEFLALEQWSVAAFFDIGNAFNHWSDPRLKRGAGVGIRWYSMLGAVRLDAAQGLDIPGKPWEIYLTIGTPLL